MSGEHPGEDPYDDGLIIAELALLRKDVIPQCGTLLKDER